MSVQICKSGNVKVDTLYDGTGGNVLIGTNYTKENPYVLSSKINDAYTTIDRYAKVTPNNVYYLTAKTDATWSPSHGYSTSTAGKVTIWLYFRQAYNSSDMGYDNPCCYDASNWVKNGVWKVTVPSGMNMARIRLNTYADGTNTVTVRFWDINLTPADVCVGIENNSKLRINKDSIVMDNFIEN